MNKVLAANKAKTEGLHFGKKSERAAIQAKTETVRADFMKDSHHYMQILINGILQRTGLSTNLGKGWLLSTHASCWRGLWMWPCDNLTYLTVPLRSAPGSNEPFCRDQYIQMLDHLRIAYGPNFEISSVAIDLIEFLIGLEFLHERSHLLDLFKLCCLCTTVTSPSYPIVTFGNVTTAEGQSRLTNVILPGQNFMANVNGSVTLCSDGSNLAAKFSLL